MAISIIDVQSQYDGPVVYYSVASDSALLEDRLSLVVTAEAGIRDTLDDLYALADGEYVSAVESLQDLADLDLADADLPAVEFTAPPFTNTPLFDPTNGVDLAEGVCLYEPGFSTVPAPDDGAPTLQHLNFTSQLDENTPQDIFPTQPGPPSLDGANTPAPNDVSEYEIDVPPVPTFNVRNFNPGTAPDPNTRRVVFDLPDPIELDEEEFLIDDQLITDAVDRLNSVVRNYGSIPDYEYLMPEVFEVVGNMLSGNAVDEADFLRDDARARFVAPSLARRGHLVPSPVTAYDAWHAGKIAEYARDSETLFLARFRDDVIVSAYSLATEAENMAADIATKMYALRRDLEVERARVSLVIAQAVASSYNAYVVLYQARVAEYNGQLEVVKGAIQALTALAQARGQTGEMNQLIGREFAQNESTKRLDVDVFAAQVQAEAAKLQAYRAKIESYEGALANARANALNYTATAAQYSGRVSQVQSRYAAYEASAQSTQTQNELAVAVQRGRGAEYEADAAKAEATARRVSAKVLEYVADHEAEKVDVADYLGNLAKSSGRFGVCVEEDLNDIRKNRLTNLSNAIPRDYLVALTERFNRYASRASDMGWRTAENYLRASESLANAYARMYEALGRAAASIEVGRLGQFRATYSTQVSGSIGVASNANRTFGTSRSLSNQQVNADTQSD